MPIIPSEDYYDPITDSIVKGVAGKGPQPTGAQKRELRNLNARQAQYEAANPPVVEPPKKEDVVSSPDEGLTFAQAKTKLEKLTNSPEQLDLVNNFVLNNPDLFDKETVDDAKAIVGIPKNVSLVSYEDTASMGGMMVVGSPEALAAGAAAEKAATTYIKDQALNRMRQDVDTAARLDAFKMIEDWLTGLGFERDMIDLVNKYMTGFTDESGNTVMVGPEEAKLLMKQTDSWKKRFSGNELLRKAGKNVLDTATYLDLERQYAEIFNAYGQGRFSNREEFGQLIGNTIAPTELQGRLKLAVNRVTNADPQVLKTMRDFYPGITDSDIVAYFLKPDQVLPELEAKVTTAEIGAAAIGQGTEYRIARERAAELQQLGVTGEEAKVGYQKVATVLPESKKLSDIYGEAKIDYTQKAAEEEFLLGSASAARKRRQLKLLEEAQFSGGPGVSSAASSLGKSISI